MIAEDVDVVVAKHSHFLSLCKRFHRIHRIAVVRGEFEFLVGGGLFHLYAQALDEVIVPAFEEQLHILHGLLVLLICRVSLNAWTYAAMNVILQARSRPLAVNLNIAVANQEISFDEFQAFPRKTRGEKRPEIQSPIFADAPGDHRSRERLVDGELYIRIGLVVPQENVVLGLVLLDQIIFQG